MEDRYSFQKILLRVECKNVLKFENYVLNFTSVFRRHVEKNVKKCPTKTAIRQFFTC